MPKLSPDAVPIHAGKIVLYKWKKSPFWQARFRIGQKWIRKTTKSEDLKEAEEIAEDFYSEAKFKVKHNLPVTSRRFKSVAQAAKKKMQDALDAEQGKVSYDDYIGVIDNYLIPFFGNHAVHTIDYSLIRQFNKWREDKLSRIPSRSTINTHTAALRRVFDEAVSLKYMTASHVPDLKLERGHGRATDRRPTFSLAEYRQLWRKSIAFKKEAVHREKSRMMRELLHEYILIVANTGVRPGTETDNLRWNHIEYDEDGDLVVWVHGKTNSEKEPRPVIPRPHAQRPFARIAERAHDLQGMSFKEVIQTDKKVFRLEDGTETKNLRQTFKALLKFAELLKCPKTAQDRVLYSLRHFYASENVRLKRATMGHLATHMGTSVEMVERHYGHLSIFDVKEDFKK